MKLLQRTKPYDSRCSSSVSDFAEVKNKMLATTRNSFASRVDDSKKLPVLNRSFSFSSAKNAKQKVGDLSGTIQELAKNITELKLNTRESRRYTSLLKQDLGERELMQCRQKLMQKINTLDKFCKMNRQHNQDQTELLKVQCQKLKESSKELKRLMQNISDRVDQLEDTMGIYSGKQKHKF